MTGVHLQRSHRRVRTIYHILCLMTIGVLVACLLCAESCVDKMPFLACATWTPDGKRIAYYDHGFIWTLNSDGSAKRKLIEGESPRWSPDGSRILYGLWRREGFDLYVVESDGSGKRRLATGLGPAWSPDGKKIAFRSAEIADQSPWIHVINADATGERRLAPGGSPKWSPDGRKMAFNRSLDQNAEIFVMNADGSDARNITNHHEWESGPVWSPDGKQIAFNRGGRDGGIWLMQPDGTKKRRLTDGHGPAWSPDVSTIAFSSYDADWEDIVCVIKADGTGERALTEGRGPSWSPDGTKILFVRRHGETKYSYCVINADGTGLRVLTRASL